MTIDFIGTDMDLWERNDGPKRVWASLAKQRAAPAKGPIVPKK
jgi:hypothetical protein